MFWGRMAGLLEEEGYEVFFIVENHSFSPHRKNVYQIPYPAVDDLKSAEDRPEFVKIRHSDRALNYFRLGSSSHYGYSDREYFKGDWAGCGVRRKYSVS